MNNINKSQPTAPAEQGNVVVTWDQSRTKILAVTRQNEDGQVLKVIAKAPPQPQPDAVDALVAIHAEMLEHNPYAYFELAYCRQTGWMAWITDKPLCAPVVSPDRKVLFCGQGSTPQEAADAAMKGQS